MDTLATQWEHRLNTIKDPAEGVPGPHRRRWVNVRSSGFTPSSRTRRRYLSWT
jgi:hypothetical protein